MDYSVIIPAYNEGLSIDELLDELLEVMNGLSKDYEIIVVDDGSTDATHEILTERHADESRIEAIRFARNFGKSAAYRAGFEAARGDVVITLDADLQDDPGEIPGMLRALREGDHDLVVGWKQERMGNEPGKAVPSRVFNGFLRLLFGLSLHDSNCGFRVMRASLSRSLDLYGDMYRFIPEIAHMLGYQVAEAPVRHRARIHGHSKYGPTRFVTGLLDLLAVRFVTAFKQRPLQFFGLLSMPLLGLGAGIELYVAIMRFGLGSSLQTHVGAIVIGVLLIVVGMQTFCTGLIGEILAANAPRRRPYRVRETVGEPGRARR